MFVVTLKHMATTRHVRSVPMTGETETAALVSEPHVSRYVIGADHPKALDFAKAVLALDFAFDENFKFIRIESVEPVKAVIDLSRRMW